MHQLPSSFWHDCAFIVETKWIILIAVLASVVVVAVIVTVVCVLKKRSKWVSAVCGRNGVESHEDVSSVFVWSTGRRRWSWMMDPTAWNHQKVRPTRPDTQVSECSGAFSDSCLRLPGVPYENMEDSVSIKTTTNKTDSDDEDSHEEEDGKTTPLWCTWIHQSFLHFYGFCFLTYILTTLFLANVSVSSEKWCHKKCRNFIDQTSTNKTVCVFLVLQASMHSWLPLCLILI